MNPPLVTSATNILFGSSFTRTHKPACCLSDHTGSPVSATPARYGIHLGRVLNAAGRHSSAQNTSALAAVSAPMRTFVRLLEISQQDHKEQRIDCRFYESVVAVGGLGFVILGVDERPGPRQS